ncbi:MAG: hypothetical protein QOJ19_2978 [Acidimicrobiia bacterium]|nr:hypothetical protein [Acidimicrobiia bacterium]
MFGAGGASEGGAAEGRISPGGATDAAVGRLARGTRDAGEPPSGNGASSFHLFWELPGEFVSVSADLEVLRTPERPRLCFWALQADFTDHGRPGGGGHLGLQFHPSYPSGTAVNWGGYAASGRELDGSTSQLKSTLGNHNTRDLAWEAGRRYRLRIAAAGDEAFSPPGLNAWRGTVTDLDSGQTVVVRDLWTTGTSLTRPMVWSEIFARCEHPSVDVRWSSFEAVAADGTTHRPTALNVNYQSYRDGGCSNTNSWLEGDAVRQMTNTERLTPQGARLVLPAANGNG